MTNIYILIVAIENTMSNPTNALHRLAEAATKLSLSRKTSCDTRQAMGVLGIFVLIPAAVVLLEEPLRASHERIIGEDIFNGSMLDEANATITKNHRFVITCKVQEFESMKIALR
jgi:hypothetical protein